MCVESNEKYKYNAYRNAGNCLASQNFGAPRNRWALGLSLFSLMVNPHLATPKGKAAQSPTKDHVADYACDLAWSYLGVD